MFLYWCYRHFFTCPLVTIVKFETKLFKKMDWWNGWQIANSKQEDSTKMSL